MSNILERKTQIDDAVREMLPWNESSKALVSALIAKLPNISDIKIEDVDDAFRRLNAAWWDNAWRLDRPKQIG